MTIKERFKKYPHCPVPWKNSYRSSKTIIKLINGALSEKLEGSFVVA